VNINLIYDTSVNSAPAAFKTALNSVVSFLDSKFTNPITVNIQVGYGEIGGQAMVQGALGESATYYNNYSYTQIRTALAQHATSADQISAVNSLPATDPTNGGNYWVTTANAKALGLMGASSAVDAYVGLASGYPFDYDNSNGVSPGTYDFFGVVAHELTETLGRTLFVGTDGIGSNAYTPLDLFHYSANGVRDFVGTTPGYFSIDGGRTNLDSFNTNPGGDFGDWAGSAGNDSFLAFSNSGVVNGVSQTDLREMNILGYSMVPPNAPPVLVAENPLAVAIGQTVTITRSALAYSDPDNTDAQLTYAVATGPASGTLLKSGAATSSFTQADIDNGLISYRQNGANVLSDSFTFTLSDPAGNSSTVQTFQLLTSKVIEAFGATKLTQVGTSFYLYNSGGSGPSLKYGGSAVVSTSYGAWTPIGAEATSTGYEVAWKQAGADQYTIWSTDSNGNYTGNPIGTVSGSASALEALEPSFQQDLNGDGTTGVPNGAGSAPGPSGTVIESRGATTLTQVGTTFYLYNSGGAGPTLKYGGTAIVSTSYGSWAPIGAEATSTGYEVAWKLAGTDQYTIWGTDSNGNYTGNPIGTVSGSAAALEALEPSFQQDLNGDGVVGVPGGGAPPPPPPPGPSGTVIEAFGATKLTQVGTTFYLYNSSGAGPTLKYGGTTIVSTSYGSWAPIGAEATSTGYEVAWKLAGSDQYTIWSTDNNGNYTGNPIGTVSGSASALEGLEPSFQQDLNGDGTIGVPGGGAPGPSGTVIESFGATSLTQVGTQFYLYDIHGVGPSLKYAGSAVISTNYGSWAPIGAEATSTGYEVAWKLAGTDQYTIWSTDSNGNYTGNPIGTVSGSASALEALEPSFQQDLNRDGVVGVPHSAQPGDTDLVWNGQPVLGETEMYYAGGAPTGSQPDPAGAGTLLYDTTHSLGGEMLGGGSRSIGAPSVNDPLHPVLANT
jgi:hypothetical protein